MKLVKYTYIVQRTLRTPLCEHMKLAEYTYIVYIVHSHGCLDFVYGFSLQISETKLLRVSCVWVALICCTYHSPHISYILHT